MIDETRIIKVSRDELIKMVEQRIDEKLKNVKLSSKYLIGEVTYD